MRHDQVEELQHHRRDAAKVSRPVLAFEYVLKVRRLDEEGLRLGVDFLFVRRKYDVHPGLFQPLAVFLQRAGVAFEILARTKLQPVHEDAYYGARRMRLRESDVLDMSVVQMAHRRHAHIVRLALQSLSQLGYGVYDVHGWLIRNRSRLPEEFAG